MDLWSMNLFPVGIGMILLLPCTKEQNLYNLSGSKQVMVTKIKTMSRIGNEMSIIIMHLLSLLQ